MSPILSEQNATLPERNATLRVAASAGVLCLALAGCTGRDNRSTTDQTPQNLQPSQRLAWHYQHWVEPEPSLAAVAGDRVYFDYDKATIRSDFMPIIVKAAAWLKKHPAVTITIEGFSELDPENGTSG